MNNAKKNIGFVFILFWGWKPKKLLKIVENLGQKRRKPKDYSILCTDTKIVNIHTFLNFFQNPPKTKLIFNSFWWRWNI